MQPRIYLRKYIEHKPSTNEQVPAVSTSVSPDSPSPDIISQ